MKRIFWYLFRRQKNPWMIECTNAGRSITIKKIVLSLCVYYYNTRPVMYCIKKDTPPPTLAELKGLTLSDQMARLLHDEGFREFKPLDMDAFEKRSKNAVERVLGKLRRFKKVREPMEGDTGNDPKILFSAGDQWTDEEDEDFDERYEAVSEEYALSVPKVDKVVQTEVKDAREDFLKSLTYCPVVHAGLFVDGGMACYCPLSRKLEGWRKASGLGDDIPYCTGNKSGLKKTFPALVQHLQSMGGQFYDGDRVGYHVLTLAYIKELHCGNEKDDWPFLKSAALLKTVLDD